VPYIEVGFVTEENASAVSQDGRGLPNPYATSERIKRAVWFWFYWLGFRWIPRFFNGWHRGALRLFGAKIGSNVLIYPSALIECPWNLILADNCVIGAGVRLYALGTISLGAHTVVSQRAHLCAGSHDYRDPRMPLLRLPITIGRGVWICTEAFIGPGVSIGDRAVVGARSVVTGHMPEDMVCAGNPCRAIKKRIQKLP
jgi:putative colanic acid biosynthesis acetyltransferase WcaF